MKLNNQPKEGLVSIIMPAYNSEQFISEAIESVINQTYTNWELIIVNDCSTDKTLDILIDYKQIEPRTRIHSLKENSGAAVARNKAIELARGDYLAFLDSDDLWLPSKLEKQLNYMWDNGYTFTSTSYDKIDENGESMNKIVSTYEKLDYFGLLKECPGNSTVIYNLNEIGKINIPNIKKRNDYVMWLQVIKKTRFIYGINEPLSSHRIREGSLSGNKFSLVKYHWQIYREIEGLPIHKSLKLMIYWIRKSII